jgi:hypothetical protein
MKSIENIKKSIMKDFNKALKNSVVKISIKESNDFFITFDIKFNFKNDLYVDTEVYNEGHTYIYYNHEKVRKLISDIFTGNIFWISYKK